MALHRLRIALDTDIPEHRVIWEQIAGLSTRGRVQFLRTHLYQSVKALADGVVGVAAVEAAPATAAQRVPRASDSAQPSASTLVGAATPPVSAGAGRKLKPFLGGAQ